MNTFEAMIEVMNKCGEDAARAYNGNKTATTRVRAAMQEVKKLAQQIREEMITLRG